MQQIDESIKTGVIAYFKQGNSYKEISTLLKKNGISVSVGSCFNIIKAWKRQEKEPPMAKAPAPEVLVTNADIKSNLPSSALSAANIISSPVVPVVEVPVMNEVNEVEQAVAIRPESCQQVNESCQQDNKQPVNIEEASVEVEKEEWPNLDPGWLMLQRRILYEKQQMRHRELVLREKENALGRRDKALEIRENAFKKAEIELQMERGSIENIKNEVTISQSRIDKVEPFLPLAQQLSNLTLNPSLALYCMSAWMNIIQQKMQSKSINLDVAIVLIEKALERYSEVERYQTDVQQLQHQLSLQNGFASQKLDAIISLINLHKLGFQDFHIIEMARRMQIQNQNQNFNSVPVAAPNSQAWVQASNGPSTNNGQGHNPLMSNDNHDSPSRKIQWPNLV